MAAPGTVQTVYQTTDGETFTDAALAEEHQGELNLRQEAEELARDYGFASSLSAVVDFMVTRQDDILLVLNGGDFEPVEAQA